MGGRISLTAGIILAALVLTGCAATTYEYTSAPAFRELKTEGYTLRFTPEKGRGAYYAMFRLEIHNFSQAPIEIDWNRTVYLEDGKNSGAFVWGEIDPKQVKEKTVPRSVIAPGQSFSKQITPFATLAIAQGKDHRAGKDEPGLYSGVLPAGNNGIRLALFVAGRPVQNVLTVHITEHRQ